MDNHLWFSHLLKATTLGGERLKDISSVERTTLYTTRTVGYFFLCYMFILRLGNTYCVIFVVQGKGNKSSGDNFHAAPNIDHSQEFVRKDLKGWLCWLRLVVLTTFSFLRFTINLFLQVSCFCSCLKYSENKIFKFQHEKMNL